LVVEEGGGASVLVLVTGLREEKRDFFGDFEIWVEDEIMPGGERASACESPSTDAKPDCNWGETKRGVAVSN
jgi:hypothetical protein